jgi:hypothetical protein
VREYHHAMADRFSNRRKLRALCGVVLRRRRGRDVGDRGEFAWHGSKGDAPDLARVTLGTTSASSVDVFYLSPISYAEALEPTTVEGERLGADNDEATSHGFRASARHTS